VTFSPDNKMSRLCVREFTNLSKSLVCLVIAITGGALFFVGVGLLEGLLILTAEILLWTVTEWAKGR
jgi:hypothetical protein